jgi:hypothetical protein
MSYHAGYSQRPHGAQLSCIIRHHLARRPDFEAPFAVRPRRRNFALALAGSTNKFVVCWNPGSSRELASCCGAIFEETAHDISH